MPPERAATARSQPRVQAVTIRRSERGFKVSWQRGGRPTMREVSDLGSAFSIAHHAAALGGLAIVDLSGGEA